MELVRLTKIQSNHKNIRTDTTVGMSPAPPMRGYDFILIAESLTPGMNARLIQTTPVLSWVRYNNIYRFVTRNSIYEVEVIEV